MLGTVTRAGRLLDLFTADAPEWGPTAVGRELGIAKSQAYELLTSLSAIGLLRRSHGGQFRLGWRNLTLGRNLLRTHFPDTASNLLRSLARAFGEPIQLVALDRDRLEIIVSRPGSHGADQFLPTHGWDSLIARCATGRCVLAGLPDPAVEEVLERISAREDVTWDRAAQDRLAAELELIRRNRVAFDRGDVRAELRAVAVPIRDPAGGTLAALGMWTTTDRWGQIGAEISEAIVGVGRRIEAALQTEPANHARPATAEAARQPIAA